MPTKILAIDDSKTMRLAIKITFAAEDAEVTAVSKGSEAIARAKQLGADIVLVDAALAAGEPSGYDVCQQLKADGETAKIPVIVLVSNQGGVDAARLKTCGADGFLAKPFETQELIDKVSELTGKGMSKAVPPTTGATVPAAAVASPVAAAPAPAPAPAPASVAARAPAPSAAPVAAPRAAAPAAASPVAAAPPVARPAPAPAPAPAVRLQPAAPAPAAARPTADTPIPIAVPIPFTAAAEATPGMLARLKAAQGGGATAGLDPKVAAAIVALSREVLEAVAWEVVPELAEQIVRARAEAKTA